MKIRIQFSLSSTQGGGDGDNDIVGDAEIPMTDLDREIRSSAKQDDGSEMVGSNVIFLPTRSAHLAQIPELSEVDESSQWSRASTTFLVLLHKKCCCCCCIDQPTKLNSILPVGGIISAAEEQGFM